MADWIVERLNRSCDRSAFHCGELSLDDFIRSFVSQYERRNLGRTYVAVRPQERRAFGYYTLAASSISFESLPSHAARKLPKHPVPAALLARLAVDRTIHGQGLGKILLKDALNRCLVLSEHIGMHAVVVDAIDYGAREFYERFGFLALDDDPLRLYLSLASVKDSIDQAR